MKNIVILILGIIRIIYCNYGKAQNRNNVWMMGSDFDKTQGLYFSNGNLDTFTVNKSFFFYFTDASISDTTGELLFYTNGSYVKNGNHDSLWNTADFNPGFTTDEYIYGLPITQGAIVLPKPGDANKYLLFHESADEIFLLPGYDVNPLSLRYSLIDMALDNSLGGIDPNQKSVVLIGDTLTNGRLTACKHANGRDWWLISHEYRSNKYYKLLVTPDGIFGPYEQNIGSPMIYDIYGYAVFSPDGNWYANLSPRDSVDIQQFNRCTGEFSNHILLNVPDSSLITTCMFSANSRFLYVIGFLNVFQYDMWSSDIPASVVHVASYDTSQTGLPRWFRLAQLAPDNKVYISTSNSTLYLHVINHPDSLGLECDLVQSAIVLPHKNGTSIPNFPNYDLGALINSPCDTLYNSTEDIFIFQNNFHIAPNPAKEWLNIVYSTKEDCLLILYDINGVRVASVSLFHYFKNRLMDVSQLPAGVYLATVSCKGERVWSENVVVQH
ncbi:MAG: T9SS type A sorting domain-containing protein [Chitinophagaceae bacterium]|nr:T9SS type A sorting domain-containing protein [Chitinophagaceae bacterium]